MRTKRTLESKRAMAAFPVKGVIRMRGEVVIKSWGVPLDKETTPMPPPRCFAMAGT